MLEAWFRRSERTRIPCRDHTELRQTRPMPSCGHQKGCESWFQCFDCRIAHLKALQHYENDAPPTFFGDHRDACCGLASKLSGQEQVSHFSSSLFLTVQFVGKCTRIVQMLTQKALQAWSGELFSQSFRELEFLLSELKIWAPSYVCTIDIPDLYTAKRLWRH